MSTSPSRFCEHCGAANEMQALICHSCGDSLQEQTNAFLPLGFAGLQIGEILHERYLIGALLGQGGMGTVYRAQDLELNHRLVAVKEVRTDTLSSKEAQEAAEAFKQEATLLASLQHPHLPSIFDHFEEKGRWYLVMSFIQGETLENYLERQKQGRLPVHEALEIGKQLCTVLSYVHSQHPPIIFRDLKPSNIMRTQDGQIYLIDFGVARHFKPGQKKDTIPFGSLGYAPPEQFGKGQTTPRSDVYSLGATLHQLLSGHDPDATPFRLPLLRTLVPSLPDELETLIAQMVEIDEAKRPANLLIVQQRLQAITSTLPSFRPLSLSPLPQRSPATPRRSLRMATLVFLALFCMVTGGFFVNAFNVMAGRQANQTPQPTQPLITDATITADAAIDATRSAQFTADSTAIAQALTALPSPKAGAPAAPIQISPASGSVFHQYPRTLTLVWNAVPEAVSYTVLIYYYQPGETACAGPDSGPYILADNLTSTAYTFDFVGEQPGCWQVWATNAVGNGQRSPLWEFSFTQ